MDNRLFEPNYLLSASFEIFCIMVEDIAG